MTIVFRNLGKGKRQKVKNSISDEKVSQTEYVIGKSDLPVMHIMHVYTYCAFSLSQISDIFFENSLIFVCLLLSWSRQYSMNWSSNFAQIFDSAICFLKKELQKKKQHFFYIFKEPLFGNGWPYWYEIWRILRDSCGLS